MSAESSEEDKEKKSPAASQDDDKKVNKEAGKEPSKEAKSQGADERDKGERDKQRKRERKIEKMKRKHALRMRHFGESMISLIIPISLTMLFTVLLVAHIKSQIAVPAIPLIMLPYPVPETVFEGTISILVFVFIICISTFLIVICVYYDLLKIVGCFVVFSVVVALTMVTNLNFHNVLFTLGIPLDWISAVFIIYNYAAVGIIALFWKCPTIVVQGYTVINCSLIALTYIYTFQNQFFVWGLLMALVFWDLFAVLAPCGPLNMLGTIIHEREYNINVPAMIYKSGQVIFMVHKSKNSSDTKSPSPATKESSAASGSKKSSEGGANLAEKKFDEGAAPGIEGKTEEEEDHSMYLGLGDFIFYSLLMGKVTEFSIRDMNSEVLIDWNMIIACYFAILLGLLLTVVVLLVFERALPALPFSLTIGIMFYFLTSTVISPFLQLMQVNMALL